MIVIDEYQPCLILPATGRTGQSTEAEAQYLAGQLERIREMPSHRFDMFKDFWIDKFAETKQLIRIGHFNGFADDWRCFFFKMSDPFINVRMAFSVFFKIIGHLLI